MEIQSHLVEIFKLDPVKRIERLRQVKQKRFRLIQQRLARFLLKHPKQAKNIKNLEYLLTQKDHQFIDTRMTEEEKVILEIIDFLDKVMGNPHAKAFLSLFANNKLPNLKELEALWRAVVSKGDLTASNTDPSKAKKDRLSQKHLKPLPLTKSDKQETRRAGMSLAISEDQDVESTAMEEKERDEKAFQETSELHRQFEKKSKTTSGRQHKNHLHHDPETILHAQTVLHQQETERKQSLQKSESQTQGHQQDARDRLHHQRILADAQLAQELDIKFQEARAKMAEINKQKESMMQHRREQQILAHRIAQGRMRAEEGDSQESAELKRAFELHKQSKKNEFNQRQKQEAEVRRLQAEEDASLRRKKAEADHQRYGSESNAKTKAAKHIHSKPTLVKKMQKDTRG